MPEIDPYDEDWWDFVDGRSIGDASECPVCDGFGRVWNKADPTSGQWVPCEVCQHD